jgi:hypothetical protein
MQWNVPKKMTVGHPVSVQVDLYGAHASPELEKEFSATGSATLQVISPMLVQLSQTDNPGAFKIEPDPVKKDLQSLPENGSTLWIWTVTPLEDGPKKLRIDAYMVPNVKGQTDSQKNRCIRSATQDVQVQVEPFGARAADFLEKNWTTLLAYLVPSGGAITLALIAWVRSSNKKRNEADAEGDDKPA